jgi:hypothetical protein
MVRFASEGFVPNVTGDCEWMVAMSRIFVPNVLERLSLQLPFGF